MKVAILISGRGSNMIALAKAIASPDFPADVVGVIADKADAAGLASAREMGLPAVAIIKQAGMSKHEHEELIHKQLEQWQTQIICLAGFMRLLSAQFIEKWPRRIINIHPSLLPKFKGLDTHNRALEAGETEHGCTVHYVTPGMDEGPVIEQARIVVTAEDTEGTLTARVLEKEHILYPAALQKVISDMRRKRA